jgi:hypothetical protein
MDFIPELDTTLSVKDRVKLLKQADQQLVDAGNELENERLTLSQRDVALLRTYASDESPKIRAVAVDILSEYGPVTWEDAERWTRDPDSDVRCEAFFAVSLSFMAISELCATDLPRCSALFEASAKLCNDMPVEAYAMCDENEEWVDLMWSMLGRLLDLGQDELSSNLICGLLEDILVYECVKFDDPRLQAWLKGDSVERKMALLSVVQWFGMKDPWQCRIAEALAKDGNKVVSGTAKSFLVGQGLPDIQCRSWAEDSDSKREQTDS